MYVVTLRKYIGLGLSAFPKNGEVAEAVKSLILAKSKSPGFIGTGFFKKARTEFRYDIYQTTDLKIFFEQKIEIDKELQSLRDVKNGEYLDKGMYIVNEMFTYPLYKEIPKPFVENLLDPSKDYYLQILNKIENSH